jgi:membrane protein
VCCPEVWLGAVLASLVWEVSKHIFVWYVVGSAHYNRFYGSISAVLILLLWGHVSGVILIWGAAFSAERAKLVSDRKVARVRS